MFRAIKNIHVSIRGHRGYQIRVLRHVSSLVDLPGVHNLLVNSQPAVCTPTIASNLLLVLVVLCRIIVVDRIRKLDTRNLDIVGVLVAGGMGAE